MTWREESLNIEVSKNSPNILLFTNFPNSVHCTPPPHNNKISRWCLNRVDSSSPGGSSSGGGIQQDNNGEMIQEIEIGLETLSNDVNDESTKLRFYVEVAVFV